MNKAEQEQFEEILGLAKSLTLVRQLELCILLLEPRSKLSGDQIARWLVRLLNNTLESV